MRVAGLVCAWWLGATVASAQQGADPAVEGDGVAEAGPEVTEARRRYAQGVVFFRASRFEEAIVELSEAYRLWSNPTILYTLGQSYERLLRVPRAIEHYRRYLEAAPADDPRRAEVEDKIRGLSTLLARVRVETNVPATVIVEGDELGTAPGSFEVATGRWEIEVRADGYETATRTVAVAAQTEQTVSFELRPAEAPSVVVVHDRGLSPVWFWTSGGLAVAAGATAAVLGALTLDAAGEYDDDPFRSPEMRDDGERLALYTDLALGASALFAIAAAVTFVLADFDGEAEPAASATIAAASNGVRTSVRIAF